MMGLWDQGEHRDQVEEVEEEKQEEVLLGGNRVDHQVDEDPGQGSLLVELPGNLLVEVDLEVVRLPWNLEADHWECLACQRPCS